MSSTERKSADQAQRRWKALRGAVLWVSSLGERRSGFRTSAYQEVRYRVAGFRLVEEPAIVLGEKVRGG